jgi:LuxR family maltose regulon positive regulatory protein
MREVRQVQPIHNTSELLSTKLALPRSRPSSVPREALLAWLDAGLQCKLTLISAPAGFGKTTLVSEWCASRGAHGSHDSLAPSTGWVALDAGDNDPVRFWRYVLTACHAFGKGAGRRPALELLRSLQLSFEGPQEFFFEPVLTALLNELAELPHQCVLVLEDYHVIVSPEIHETMAFFLDHLPDNVHIIILTRSDPPLPLARLRARNDTVELRAADMRFSLEETRAFLRQALPFAVSGETITRLQERTEGWAAGLNLMALALQARPDSGEREHFLATFSGSYRHILEYLVGDVLNAQPEPLQTFLLQTSGLSRMTGSLCDAVTGRNDGESVLEELERANSFLLPLDGSGQWYRYHALFAEAMLHEARHRFGDDELRACYARAGNWYEEHGLLTEAIEAALSARDFGRAARLIETVAGLGQFTQLPELHTLRRWVEQLPEDVISTHPALSFSYAAAVMFTSDRSAPSTRPLVEAPLQKAERGFRDAGDRVGIGVVLSFRALLAWWQGDIEQTVVCARQSLEWLPQDDRLWRGVSLGFVGGEELFAGRIDAARKTILEAQALCEAAGNTHAARAATLMLGTVSFERGELRQAAELYSRALTEAEEEGDTSDMGPALLGLARLSHEWDTVDLAKQQAQRAFDLGKELNDDSLQAYASIVLALVSHASGQTAQVRQRLAELAARTTLKRLPPLYAEILTYQASLDLAAGDLAAVQRWVTALSGPGEAPAAPKNEALLVGRHEREEILIARLLIAQGNLEEALGMLGRMRAAAQEAGRIRSALEIRLLTAVAHTANGQPGEAMQEVREVLAFARPEGYRRLFLSEGPGMAALLRAALPEMREELMTGYIHSLLRGFEGSQPAVRRGTPTPPAISPPLVEPLSPQEQRVLRLFAAGLSRQEIAQELIVSVNTVKTHLQRVYRKLNVTSRTEARETARQLHLL